MSRNFSLKDYAQIHDRSVFVDANVLIYLFWPTGSHYWETNYAKAYNKLLKQQNPLFIDFTVLSEVINRVIRIEHQKINPQQSFKDYRDSQDGKEAFEDIHTILRDTVLNRFGFIGKAFQKEEIEDMLVLDELDFNDKAIVRLCEENFLVLLTNDQDFKNSGLDILTGNPRILHS